MEINEHLIESWNSRGYVVRFQEEDHDNKFGKTHMVKVETSTHTITYVTNVLNGVNYFKIYMVEDLYKNRTYYASRYHFKYISLVSEVNGEVFIKIKNNND